MRNDIKELLDAGKKTTKGLIKTMGKDRYNDLVNLVDAFMDERFIDYTHD